jgi:hypothetical protein
VTRIERAIRRCHRADVLGEQAKMLLDQARDLALGDPARVALLTGATALDARCSAWIALAGGDAATAREHLQEARFYAAQHRKAAAQVQRVAA